MLEVWRPSTAMSIAFKKHIAVPEQKDGKTAVGTRRKDSQKDLDGRSLMRLNSTYHSADGKHLLNNFLDEYFI